MIPRILTSKIALGAQAAYRITFLGVDIPVRGWTRKCCPPARRSSPEKWCERARHCYQCRDRPPALHRRRRC